MPWSGGLTPPSRSPRGRRLPSAHRPAILYPRKRFRDENLVVRKLHRGTARLRWGLEDSEHRRTAARQRDSRGSVAEQGALDTRQPGVPAKHRRLEIILEDVPLTAPRKSAETNDFTGRTRRCQRRSAQPPVGLAGAHGNPRG